MPPALTAEGHVEIAIDGPWEVADPDGGSVNLPGLGDWSTEARLERFSGTLRYVASIELGPDHALWRSDGAAMVELDLGVVGEAAEVFVNGVRAGAALWAPHAVRVGARSWQSGQNRLEVRITNSAANRYEGAMRPSGLMGPVVLRLRWATG